MPNLPTTERLAVGAAFLTLADRLMHGGMPVPEDVDLYKHGLTADELTCTAAHYERPILPSTFTARVSVQLAIRDENGVNIEMTFFSGDVSNHARAQYATYNDKITIAEEETEVDI
jgi:hypothetical protein